MQDKIQCPHYSGTFAKTFCAESHKKANTPEAIQNLWRVKCRRCEIGARCLGSDEFLERPKSFASKRCARCERLSGRLVRKTVCVSCYNREQENACGLNAKGTPLRLVRYYKSALVKFLATDGTIKKAEFETVLTTEEAARSICMVAPDIKQIFSIDLLPWARDKKI